MWWIKMKWEKQTVVLCRCNACQILSFFNQLELFTVASDGNRVHKLELLLPLFCSSEYWTEQEGSWQTHNTDT